MLAKYFNSVIAETAKYARYHTIMADPAWAYNNIAINPFATASWQYSTMSTAQICRLNVQSVSEDNAHLYLCVTNAFMEEGFAVAKAWGFTPKTIITWCKVCKDGITPRIGLGYYFRNTTEHVLFCVRGSQRLNTTAAIPTHFLAERSYHSKKPDELYRIIEKASPGPYLEMNCRTPRPGWDAWGNEVDTKIRIGVRCDITQQRH